MVCFVLSTKNRFGHSKALQPSRSPSVTIGDRFGESNHLQPFATTQGQLARVERQETASQQHCLDCWHHRVHIGHLRRKLKRLWSLTPQDGRPIVINGVHFVFLDILDWNVGRFVRHSPGWQDQQGFPRLQVCWRINACCGNATIIGVVSAMNMLPTTYWSAPSFFSSILFYHHHQQQLGHQTYIQESIFCGKTKNIFNFSSEFSLKKKNKLSNYQAWSIDQLLRVEPEWRWDLSETEISICSFRFLSWKASFLKKCLNEHEMGRIFLVPFVLLSHWPPPSYQDGSK